MTKPKTQEPRLIRAADLVMAEAAELYNSVPYALYDRLVKTAVWLADVEENL